MIGKKINLLLISNKNLPHSHKQDRLQNKSNNFIKLLTYELKSLTSASRLKPFNKTKHKVQNAYRTQE